jgi:exodeoxyribonuclease VII large subunit
MPSEITGIKLSELSERIKSAIEREFGSQQYWVIAEIVGHKQPKEKSHHYFDLIEKGDDNKTLAKISTKAWSKGSEAIRNFEHYTNQKFHDGIKVLVSVTVEYSTEYGLQLILHDVDVQFTLGQIQQNKQNVVKRLLNECRDYVRMHEGTYRTKNKSLPLPTVIQNIAVITSEKSAGYEDFAKKLENNSFGYSFKIQGYFAVVQGEKNAAGIKAKLIEIFHDQERMKFDAVVIIRGGGSPMDLLIFDDYYIAQAVAKFPIPIITGIGHQTDETITDLMAHTCKNAPTGVASFIIEHNKKFDDRLHEIQSKMVLVVRQILAQKKLNIANANTVISQRSNNIISKNKDTLNIMNQSLMEKTRRLVTRHKDILVSTNQIIIEKSRKIISKNKDEISFISSGIIAKPRIRIGILKGEISNMIGNLNNFSNHFFDNKRGYLGHYREKFEDAKPEKILKMGFAILLQNGKPISNPEKIKTGTDLSVLLAETKINTIVKSKEKSDGREFDL